MKIVTLIIMTLFLCVSAFGAEFSICTGSGNQRHPEVVFDGSFYRAVYDSMGDIWFATITPEGVLGSNLRLTSGTDQDSTPSIAFDGTNFFVVWTRISFTYGAIVNQNGQVIQGPFYIPMNGKFHPVIAFTNSRFLIAASYYIIGSQGVLEGIIYNNNYNPVGNYFRIAETPTNYSGFIGHSAICGDGTKFMVLYPYSIATEPNYQNTLSFKFVTTTGSVGSEVVVRSISGTPTSHDTVLFYPPDIAFNSTKYFIVYHFAESGSSNGAYNNLYGRVVNTDGSWGSNEISIATQSNINELAGTVAAEDKNFIVVWQDFRAGNYNLYRKYYSETGAGISGEATVTTAANHQTLPQITSDGLNNLVVWQDYRSGSNWDIYGNLLANFILTDDPLALAYNGNRHLVRKPNTNEFHMVYTRGGKVMYRYSSNEGVEWPRACTLGTGKLPSIALSPAGLAHVTWTDNAGGLWFRHQTDTKIWSSTYHLFAPSSTDPLVNSPPSIGLVVNRGVVYPHILVTRTGQGSGNVPHRVEDFTFPVTDPNSGTFELIEARSGPANPPLRINPSIVKDDADTLHAVWQRATTDTIAYATRYRIGSWQVWGDTLAPQGRQSAHPFPEPYGNRIYIVWQSKYPYGTEEVWRAYRTSGENRFPYRYNISNTPSTRSFYPTSASGFFTVFSDEHDPPWDIYATYFGNISQSPGVTSQYSHSCMKYGAAENYLYTIWLEGNSAPYQLMFKKITYVAPPAFAYITSPAGQSSPSPYLVNRDGYISTGQVPIDYGYSSVQYRFPLLPDFIYKLKTTLYFEGSGIRTARIKAESFEQTIQYNANSPRTVEFIIPPQLYQDTILQLALEKISGNFISVGPIEIYRYEYEGSGGPQDAMTIPINMGKLFLNINPKPVRNKITIQYTLQQEAKVNLSIYDATGRLADVLVNAVQEPGSYHKTLHGSNLAQGIYFVRLSTTEQSVVQKVIFLR
ncbi:MAG: T9SS type A sorting domain-containing protein [bacterium]